ncbi:MAG: pyridoxal-phosphate dependent enzyme [Pseudomonadota bacterium]
MIITKNRFRGTDSFVMPTDVPSPSVNAEAPLSLLAQCPAYETTPLVDADVLAAEAGVAKMFLKDERSRMGLGSFKALGAAYVIAREAASTNAEDMSTALKGQKFVTASAGNHGLSVAAGAAVFGAQAIIYLAHTVPKAFGARLEAKGAIVRYEGDDYEASMKAAANAANLEGLSLLSDSSWEDYFDPPHRLMEGYLASASETTDQMPEAPTHIFLQAGVGGLAGAMAAYFRHVWGDGPNIVVVEPNAAPALLTSIAKGEFTKADGPVSNMGRLDCKEASLIALKSLARDADFFMTISDGEASSMVEKLKAHDLESTPSGIAGVAAAFNKNAHQLGLGPDSVVLAIISEGPEA